MKQDLQKLLESYGLRTTVQNAAHYIGIVEFGTCPLLLRIDVSGAKATIVSGWSGRYVRESLGTELLSREHVDGVLRKALDNYLEKFREFKDELQKSVG